MIRLIFHIPINLILLIINVFFIIFGWIVIPLALLFKAYDYRKSKYWDYEILDWTWPFMKVYSNEEDGLDNQNRGYYGIKKEWPLWRKIIAFSLIRNPASGLRWIPYVSCMIDPKKVDFIGNYKEAMDYDQKPPRAEWFYCWCGLYSCIWIQFKFRKSMYRLWIGQAVYPSDIFGVTEYRKYGAGFKIQLKRIS